MNPASQPSSGSTGSAHSPRTAVVVGAGIVGICCAIELRRRGLAVTLLDRLAPAEACSAGNAGILAAHAVVPIGLPGLHAQAAAMLLSRESPLVLRLGSLHHAVPWIVRLLRTANEPQVRRTAAAMKALYGSTVARHQALAAEAGVPELIRAQAGLYVHPAAGGIDLVGGLAWQLRREHGAQFEVLEGAALREAEPALSPTYTRGVRMGPMAHTVNPQRLARAYAALAQRLGVSVVRDELRALQPPAGGSGPVQLLAAQQRHTADVVVLATGAWTAPLLRPLGCRLPLLAERGYHLTYADPGFELNHVVSEIAAHVAVTSMEPGLRIAGTEEIGLADAPPDWRRAEVLHRLAQRMFPGARLTQGSRWMGPRPGLPDSLPAIGPVPGAPAIWVAAGHGHLGLTGAPHTGDLVARGVCGEHLGAALGAYAPSRFM
ncbi:MAG: FAD-dependent oxidoreductase [Rubrivivax sp.]|nr:FAD-dependent oxidoreductase [Rubrivivax sp.]